MAPEPLLAVKVWGDFACFTRPEMKVERVTYPVMTPSAARGVLEAIFWKPEFRWRIAEIHVLKPIHYISLLRNEVTKRASAQVAQNWSRTRGGLFVEDQDPNDPIRAQRNTLALRDVAYVIRAEALPHSGDPGDRAKYRDQFRRRVERGQCFATPYLGCREWSASFGTLDGTEQPIAESSDLGRMLWTIDYAPGDRGTGTPRFFDARLERGILRVPSEEAA